MKKIEREATENEPTNITPQIEEDFDALASGDFGNFALLSCFVNGEPTAAIVVAEKNKKTKKVEVVPLFVAVTSSMMLVDHDGKEVEHAKSESENDPDPDDEDEENYND